MHSAARAIANDLYLDVARLINETPLNGTGDCMSGMARLARGRKAVPCQSRNHRLEHTLDEDGSVTKRSKSFGRS